MPFKDVAERKAYHRMWYLKNRAAVIAHSSAWLAAHKDDPQRKRKVAARMHLWYLENKDRIKEVHRVWAENNADKKAAHARKHYSKNSAICKARHRKWVKLHPDRTRLYHFRRRVEKEGSPLSMETLKKVLERNANRFGELTCVYCGPMKEKKLTIDHLIPIARGGDNSVENLAVSCFSCNAKKYTKTHEEFVRMLTTQGELQSQI